MPPTSSSEAPQKPITVDLEALVVGSWRQFASEPVAYVLGTLLVAAGALVSLGILFGPFAVGFIRMAERGRKGESISAAEVIDGMRDFVPATLTALILLGGSIIGTALIVLPGVVLTFLWSYCLYFVALRNCGPLEALSAAWDLARSHVGSVLVVLLCCVALNAIGAMAAGVGLLISMPLSVIFMTRSFADLAPISAVEPAEVTAEAADESDATEGAADTDTNDEGDDSTT